MGKLYPTTVTSARPREREYKFTNGAGLYLLVKPNRLQNSSPRCWRHSSKATGFSCAFDRSGVWRSASALPPLDLARRQGDVEGWRREGSHSDAQLPAIAAMTRSPTIEERRQARQEALATLETLPSRSACGSPRR